MSLVHLHLLLNHVPVIGSVFAVFIFLVALRMKSSDVTKVGLAMLALVGAVAAVVFLTGEPAEGAVENLAGVSESVINGHEEAAEVALVASVVVGAFALLAVWWRRRAEMPRWLSGAALVASLAVTGSMGWTAYLGGQIRHSEIRTASSATDAGERGAVGEGREAGERERRR